MLTDMSARQAAIVGLHVHNVNPRPDHIKHRLHEIQNDDWSALTPSVTSLEVLICNGDEGKGILVDHAMLVDEHSKLRNFATFAVSASPSTDPTAVLLTFTVASTSLAFGRCACVPCMRLPGAHAASASGLAVAHASSIASSIAAGDS